MSKPDTSQQQASDAGRTSRAEGASGHTSAQPDLSYEQARSQLVEVVTQLESGGAPLDESLALWERGERLAEICQRWLDGAQAKIAARTKPQDGGN